MGSTPTGATKFLAAVALMVEQRTCNATVGGSSPLGGSKHFCPEWLKMNIINVTPNNIGVLFLPESNSILWHNQLYFQEV